MAAFVLIANGVFLLEGALLFGASFGAFLGEGPMIASGVLAMALWGTLCGFLIYATTLAVGGMRGDADKEARARTWSSALYLCAAFLSVGTGLGLGFGAFASCGPLFLAPFYHWVGLIGAVLGFTAYFVLPLIAGIEGHRWWVALLMCGLSGLLWGLAWLIGWVVLSGSIAESKYPAAASSPFKLPWPGGESSWVIQGNSSGLNHDKDEEFAYDFRRRCGSPVLAARKGEVVDFEDRHAANGSDKPNNFIWIKHDDGSVAKYLHLMTKSVKVKKGATVTQGQELAKVGNVGNSMTGHIHFIVVDKEKGGKNIPVAFSDSDLKGDKGIPRTFRSYESANRK